MGSAETLAGSLSCERSAAFSEEIASIAAWPSERICAFSLRSASSSCFDLRGRQLGLFQVLDRAALRVEAVAVACDELALREVAIDEAAGVDRCRAVCIHSGVVAIAAEDEHAAADERDGPDPGEQQLLALRDLGIEITPPALAGLRRTRHGLCFGLLRLCWCLGHQSSPPFAKTRKALVASPGASASRP